MAIDIEKIQESPHVLDLLIQMEDVLDSLDIYVFKNWYGGEVVEGPSIKRYWLDFTLKYEKEKKPDLKGAHRLLKHGVRVNFEKMKLASSDANKDMEPRKDEETDEDEDFDFWFVKLSIPRKLVNNIANAELDFYDDDIDYDDVEDAKDTGMDDETQFMNDDEGGDEGAAGGAATEPAPVEDEKEGKA